MTCPVSKRFLDDLGKASEYATPERTIEDARRDCGAIRRKLIEHAAKHDCLKLGAAPKRDFPRAQILARPTRAG